MDFDFLMVGNAHKYKGKEYMFVKGVNEDYIMVAEVGAEMPTPVVIIPRDTIKDTTTPPKDKDE